MNGLRANPDELAALIERIYPDTAADFPLDFRAALFALCGAESGYEIDAVGKKGELGILQVLPSSWPNIGTYPQDNLAAQLEWARPVVMDLVERLGSIAGALAANAVIDIPGDAIADWPALAWQLAPATLARAVVKSRSPYVGDWINQLWPVGSDAKTRGQERARLSRYRAIYDKVNTHTLWGALTTDAHALADAFKAFVDTFNAASLAFEGVAFVATVFGGWLAWKLFLAKKGRVS